MQIFSRTLFSLSLAVCPLAQYAVELPDIISDNAVLQQNSNVKLWGWSEPGRTVKVTSSWAPGKSYTAKAAPGTGRWEVEVATPAASFTPQSVSFETEWPLRKSIMCLSAKCGYAPGSPIWKCP